MFEPSFVSLYHAHTHVANAHCLHQETLRIAQSAHTTVGNLDSPGKGSTALQSETRFPPCANNIPMSASSQFQGRPTHAPIVSHCTSAASTRAIKAPVSIVTADKQAPPSARDVRHPPAKKTPESICRAQSRLLPWHSSRHNQASLATQTCCDTCSNPGSQQAPKPRR